MKNLLFYTILWAAGLKSSAQNLTSIERDLITAAQAHNQYTLDLVQKTANINSGTLNIAGVKKVGEIYATELRMLGFKVVWVALPDSMKRAGHLVATRSGTKGKKLFLIGHLDTVFEENMPFSPYTILNDSTAKGQGVSDMKGGNAMIISSLKTLHDKGQLENRDICVYFTGDEEFAGRPLTISRADFKERAQKYDVALAYETTITPTIATTARRGICSWKLTINGRQGHSAGVFGQMSGFGAIYEMARILEAFRVEFSKEEYLTVNTGMISGGSDLTTEKEGYFATGKTNIIPRLAIAEGDMRYLTTEQRERTQARMRQIVTENLHQTKATITFDEGIPSMAPTPQHAAVLKLFSQASVDFGLGVVEACDPGLRGAGDIAYVADILPCLDGLGAMGTGAHSPSETLDTKWLNTLTQRNTLFLYRLLQ